MDHTIKNQVIQQLEMLPESLQREVLAFVQALRICARRGVPGKQLLSFSGIISPDDLELMRQAIEDECEQVNSSEW